jgi:large subunit ribosomal protein L18
LNYVRTLKRIREDKTNYRKRSAILIGRHLFIAIKVSDQNVSAQVLKATPTGDIVITSAHSRELAKHGWKGALNNLPACYLTGMLLGKKALEKGINNAVLYIGKSHFTSRVAACMKGIVDTGVSMPISEESLPDEQRIGGHHIAEYSRALAESRDEYNSRFSAILKSGLKPEDYPLHFEEVKNKISSKSSKNVVPQTIAGKEVSTKGEEKEENSPNSDDAGRKKQK